MATSTKCHEVRCLYTPPQRQALLQQSVKEAKCGLDPQLHTHNVLLNMQQRSDGIWQTLDNTAIFRTKMLLALIHWFVCLWVLTF